MNYDNAFDRRNILRYVSKMIHIDSSIARIRAYLKTALVAKSKLASMAGLYEACIRDVESPQWNPTARTLRKIEMAIPSDFDFSEQCKPLKSRRK